MLAYHQLRIACAGPVHPGVGANGIKQDIIAAIEFAIRFADHLNGVFGQVVGPGVCIFFRQHIAAIAVQADAARVNVVEVADAQGGFQERIV
jgi:hypothetical protein